MIKGISEDGVYITLRFEERDDITLYNFNLAKEIKEKISESLRVEIIKYGSVLLHKTMFWRALLNNVDLTNRDLRDIKFYGHIVFIELDFSGSIFNRADLSDVYFERCNLSNVNFTDTIFNSSTTFSGCNLTGAKFNKTEVTT